jgi:hypothetical protein
MQTSGGRACLSAQLLDRLGAFVKQVENAVPDGSLDNQRRREAKSELHKTFRRQLRSRIGCHVSKASTPCRRAIVCIFTKCVAI